MNTYSFLAGTDARRTRRLSLLTVLWFAGLSFGICFAAFSPYDALHIFSVLASEGSSVFPNIFATAFPIAVCSVALGYPAFALCYPVVFTEALCRGFCGMLVFAALGSGAWLVRFLLLFSSGIVSVIMWWLLLRHTDKPTTEFSKDVCISAALTGVVIVLDIIWVSPVLSGFTKYF